MFNTQKKIEAILRSVQRDADLSTQYDDNQPEARIMQEIITKEVAELRHLLHTATQDDPGTTSAR